MKILHVITSLRTGGAEKLMVDLLPRFRDKGYEVDLCVFDGVDTPFKQELEAQGIKIISLGDNPNIYHPLYLKRLYSLIHNSDYDIIHTHNTAPQLFAALASLRCKSKLVTTEHSTVNRRREWKWYAKIDRWMYSRYSAIICISDKTETHLTDFIGENPKILTINNGIDVRTYADAEPFDFRKDYPEAKTIVIQVAAFRDQKDQDTTIRSMSYLPNDVHLFLVGDGVRRPELEALVKSLNLEKRVHLLGFQTNVPSLIKGSDIVVMSSHFEGFGLAAVEGMAAWRPVLASDVDGLREVVQGAGVLFPPGQFRTLAKAIMDLATDPERYKAVAAACYERAKDYDISTMADKYSEVYQNLMK